MTWSMYMIYLCHVSNSIHSRIGSKIAKIWDFSLKLSHGILRMFKLTLIEKDRCIIYFIRWLTCGWKEAYFIEMFKRHRAAEFILRGIRIDPFQRFFDRHIDTSDKPAFMLSDGFIRNQKQFTCDKAWFGNFDGINFMISHNIIFNLK